MVQQADAKAVVRSLEAYLRETRKLPRGSTERLHAYRHVFSTIIAALPAHGPLLADVKAEYEATVSALSARNPAKEPLPNDWPDARRVHPLKLPAQYYQHALETCEVELESSHAQANALRRMVNELRIQRADGEERMRGRGGRREDQTDRLDPGSTLGPPRPRSEAWTSRGAELLGSAALLEPVPGTHGGERRRGAGAEEPDAFRAHWEARRLRASGSVDAAADVARAHPPTDVVLSLLSPVTPASPTGPMAMLRSAAQVRAASIATGEGHVYAESLGVLELRVAEAAGRARVAAQGALANRCVAAELKASADASVGRLRGAVDEGLDVDECREVISAELSASQQLSRQLRTLHKMCARHLSPAVPSPRARACCDRRRARRPRCRSQEAALRTISSLLMSDTWASVDQLRMAIEGEFALEDDADADADAPSRAGASPPPARPCVGDSAVSPRAT